jgi:hypothetical protein
MEQVDYSTTLVLLIGVSNFPSDASIHSIPNVVPNIEKLRELLLDKDFVGIPEENLTISLNECRSKIINKLISLGDRSRKKNCTIFIYYAGHGFLNNNDFKLYLFTNDTVREFLESDSIEIDILKRLIDRSQAGRKIVILDCCHSGAILNHMGSKSDLIQVGINSIEGTYVITSTPEDLPALYPEDKPDEPTYFTGKLIELVKEGINHDREYLSFREIFNTLYNELQKLNLPKPQ